jgi:hypothetical protein
MEGAEMDKKLQVDDTLQLSPVWSSANDIIASVSDSGLVTANSPGTVEIYCTIGGLPFATIIAVSPKPPKDEEPARV